MSTLPTRATPRHASPERRANSLMRFFVSHVAQSVQSGLMSRRCASGVMARAGVPAAVMCKTLGVGEREFAGMTTGG